MNRLSRHTRYDLWATVAVLLVGFITLIVSSYVQFLFQAISLGAHILFWVVIPTGVSGLVYWIFHINQPSRYE